MPKPERYPLPWNDAHDEPYWQTNMRMCFAVAGWRERQAGRSMGEIIKEIESCQPLKPTGATASG